MDGFIGDVGRALQHHYRLHALPVGLEPSGSDNADRIFFTFLADYANRQYCRGIRRFSSSANPQRIGCDASDIGLARDRRLQSAGARGTVTSMSKACNCRYGDARHDEFQSGGKLTRPSPDV